MSVEMKLGRWMDRSGTQWLVQQHVPGAEWPWRCIGGPSWRNDGTRYSNSAGIKSDLVRYLGPLELSPTPACADQAGTPVVSTVSTETAVDQLRRMRQREAAIWRELEIYLPIVDALKNAVSDLGEEIKRLEREVEG